VAAREGHAEHGGPPASFCSEFLNQARELNHAARSRFRDWVASFFKHDLARTAMRP